MAQRDVLIVANEPTNAAFFKDVFFTAGYKCLVASDEREGLEMFRGARPPLVVTDLNLTVMTDGKRVRDAGAGARLLQKVRREDPDAAVIVLWGNSFDEKPALACLKFGAYALLEKIVTPDALLIAAERALDGRQLLTEGRYREFLERHVAQDLEQAYRQLRSTYRAETAGGDEELRVRLTAMARGMGAMARALEVAKAKTESLFEEVGRRKAEP